MEAAEIIPIHVVRFATWRGVRQLDHVLDEDRNFVKHDCYIVNSYPNTVLRMEKGLESQDLWS